MKKILNTVFDLFSIVWIVLVALTFIASYQQGVISKQDYILLGLALITLVDLIRRKKS